MEKTVTKPTDWPDLAGRLTESGHVLPVRVYYEDTDFSGLVYHASYVRFLERGRSDWLRLLGVGHEALARGEFGAASLAFAVARMTIDFKKPARIDEALAIETHVKAIGGAIIKLTQTVRREESVLVTAEVSVVLVNAAGKPQRIPRDLLQALSKRS
jgi:acyl-CoA thioester hydrolase